MKVRRPGARRRAALGGLLGAAAFGLALFPAAGAQADTAGCQAKSTNVVDVTITDWEAASPGASQCTPASGMPVAGVWHIHFDAASVDSLSSFGVAIIPVSNGVPALAPAAVVSKSYPATLVNPQSQDSIDQSWDTRSLTPYNGRYELSATATSLLNWHASTTVPNVLVNNPPATPTGVAVNVSGGAPVVSWAANPEPDITGYQVLRSANAGAYAVIASPSGATSYTDHAVPTGTAVSYEVVAVRSSPVSPGGIASANSGPTAVVTLGAPTAKPGAPAAGPAGHSVGSTKSTASVTTPGKAVTTGPALNPGVDTSVGGFAPTLPLGQVPTATEAPAGNSNPAVITGPQTLAGEGTGTTTTPQKLRYLATAAFLLIVAFVVIRYATQLLRAH